MAHGTHDFEDDARNERILVWVNGELVPRERAVAGLRSGFLAAAGVVAAARARVARARSLHHAAALLAGRAQVAALDIFAGTTGGVSVSAAVGATEAPLASPPPLE